MKHILKPAFSLFIIAAVTTTLIALAHSLTLRPIADQVIKTREKTMKTIMPEALDFREVTIEKSGNIDGVFEANNRNDTLGYIVALSPSGYSGKINMMVGIMINRNEIAGLRILKHSETPGLGALAVKEKFYRKYDNRKIAPLRVVRNSPGENDIEAITGATITTRAITGAVNEAIEWYRAIENNNGVR